MLIRHTLNHTQVSGDSSDVPTESDGVSSPFARSIVTVTTTAGADFLIKSALTIDRSYLWQVYLLGNIIKYAFDI